MPFDPAILLPLKVRGVALAEGNFNTTAPAGLTIMLALPLILRL